MEIRGKQQIKKKTLIEAVISGTKKYLWLLFWGIDFLMGKIFVIYGELYGADLRIVPFEFIRKTKLIYKRTI